MFYPDSAMARCDPSSEKENLVPRAHRSEPGSGGLGSVRTRGLMNHEQRLQTVLKESSLQNQVSLWYFNLVGWADFCIQFCYGPGCPNWISCFFKQF